MRNNNDWRPPAKAEANYHKALIARGYVKVIRIRRADGQRTSRYESRKFWPSHVGAEVVIEE